MSQDSMPRGFWSKSSPEPTENLIQAHYHAMVYDQPDPNRRGYFNLRYSKGAHQRAREAMGLPGDGQINWLEWGTDQKVKPNSERNFTVGVKARLKAFFIYRKNHPSWEHNNVTNEK